MFLRDRCRNSVCFQTIHPKFQTFFRIYRTSEVKLRVKLGRQYALNFKLSQTHLTTASIVPDFILQVHTVRIHWFFNAHIIRIMRMLYLRYLGSLFLPAYFMLSLFTAKTVLIAINA